MTYSPQLGALDVSRMREALGVPAITPRNVAAAAAEAINTPWSRAAGNALRAGGGAKEAAVAAMRTTPTGQEVEDEWRRQKAAELVETLQRAVPWAVGGWLLLRALR